MPPERVDLADDGTLGDPADRGIARHLTDRFQILGQQQRLCSGARSERRSLHAGVTAADDDDIVPVCHVSNLRG